MIGACSSSAALHAIDEVLEVIAVAVTLWPGFELIGEPRLVAVVAVDAEIAVRTVEDIAEVRLGSPGGPQRMVEWQALVRIGGQTCRGNALLVRASADFGFVIRHPRTDFNFEHFALAVSDHRNRKRRSKGSASADRRRT